MTKNILVTSMVVLLVILVGVGAFLIYDTIKPEPFIEVNEYYDIDGNLISGTTQSVIGDVEGVKYITLKINIENKDTVGLTLNVKSLTPSEEAKPTNSIEVGAGENGDFVTGLIDVEPYEGTIQEFCVVVESEKILALRESSEVSGCISIQVDPNPSGSFNINIESNIGDGVINPSCTEDWDCSAWNSCSSGLQTRVCNDLNSCDSFENKPTEEQACEVVFQTNAVGGDYDQSGVWIDFGSGVYLHGGISSYDCLSENIITITPEGNLICTRPGYEITERVYLRVGSRGVIFKP